MEFNVNQAMQFVEAIDLTGTPQGLLPKSIAPEAGEIFDKAKAQAQVVGSGIYSFATGVSVETREAISDSALLAQLVANLRDPDHQNPFEWFNAYSDVLQNVGWTLQEKGFTDYTPTGMAADVHEKILEVMTVALGPSAAALSIINSTITALKGMKSDSPWITIFSRESRKAKLARFQIGFVEKEEKSDVFVSLLACLIEANSNITQVLFFKWREDRASFKANTAKVSINRPALVELRPYIRDKVRIHELNYLSSVFDVPKEAVKRAVQGQKVA